MIQISSSKNPIIKEIKSLYRKKDRWNNKLYIIEGTKLINEAINYGIDIKYIIYTEKLLKTEEGLGFYNLLNKLRNLINIPESLFKEICDTENSQGVLAVVSFRINDTTELFSGREKFLLYLDGLQDPGNLGTIIRSADAFKADGILLSEGCVDPYNSKVVRATMGSIFRVPLYFIKDDYVFLNQLKEKNYRIYATSLEGSIPNYEITYKDNFIIVIGNESRGISDNIINLADRLIKIPMPGFAESLNAGVAASIILYEAMKQRGKKS
ncbi:RNA methyltransferase [Tissierella sp. Yu-01]|uniref:TrmH family RNA methyltransferase n=1 Tax=Tissierella sp. Yu-01 TaxID=3035694 RepID=UPI00240E0855|nr:RNA methyltransferase [Tissierella sp. Yu-01]WFA09880.1 RNA methyltransferase [Tissierella sp. Yu-01]